MLHLLVGVAAVCVILSTPAGRALAGFLISAAVLLLALGTAVGVIAWSFYDPNVMGFLVFAAIIVAIGFGMRWLVVNFGMVQP